MSRRTERVGNLIRNTLGQLLLSKMSDPRFDSARTSITRVEVPEDLLTARVFVSVTGSAEDQHKTIAALKHAVGYLQERLGREVRLRNTPRLSFEIDVKFKKTLETLSLLSEISAEREAKEQARQQQDDENLNQVSQGEADETIEH
ncbi:MAG: 30S ribosome-binding factor RbfA [Phycisphaerae bacterium]|nr:30S ribosome-binding factor RbfA [Phycisphaerae bacterium]